MSSTVSPKIKIRYGVGFSYITIADGSVVPPPDWMIEKQVLQNYEKLIQFKGNKVKSWCWHFARMVDLIFGDPQGMFYFQWNPNAMRILLNFHKHPILAIAGHASSSKCLAPHTKVRMYDGSVKRADEVQIGDKLAGDALDAKTVLNTGTGSSMMVRIVPERGDPWECNDDHILTLKRTWAHRKSRARVGDVVDISVKDYLRTSQTFKNQHKLFCVPVDYPEQQVAIDPQVYGIWLGDGGTNKPSITISDQEVEVGAFVRGYFADNGYSIHEGRFPNRCPSPSFSKFNPIQGRMSSSSKRGRSGSDFLDLVRRSSGCISANEKGEKRILPEYMYNSRENRLKLLAGILDADGCAAGTNFLINSSYPRLAKDIVQLARSLGFRVTTSDRQCKCVDKYFPSTAITITGDVQEIPTLRKKCPEKLLRKNSTCTSFSIEHLGIGPWAGFTLDGNGRFLLEDFTVTHNTESSALIASLMFWLSPKDTQVLVTSKTVSASQSKVWGKVKQVWNHMDIFLAKWNVSLPGKLLDSKNKIRYHDENGKASELSGITLVVGEQSQSKETAAKIQGIKQKNVLLVGDEFATLEASLLNTALSNLKSNPNFRMLAMFNPESYFDPGGIVSRPKNGWHTVTENDYEWETLIEPFGITGYCIRFDGLQSPNVVAGEEIWKGLLTKEYMDSFSSMGTKTKAYYTMFRGFWIPGGTTETIYSAPDIHRWHAHERVTTWAERPTKIAALDPSFAHGGDKAVLVIGNVGMATIILPPDSRVSGLSTTVDANGNLQVLQKVCEVAHEFVLDEDITNTTMSKSEWVVKLTKEKLKFHQVDVRNFACDATGGGEPFAALITRDIGAGFLNIKFSGKASETPVSRNDKRKGFERFKNMVSELWYVGRELIRTGQFKGITPSMQAEMVVRTYEERGGIVQVEPKEDMKKRTNGKSPDRSDSAFMLLFLARIRHGLNSNEIAAPRAVQKPTNTNSLFSTPDLSKPAQPQRTSPNMLVSGGGWGNNYI